MSYKWPSAPGQPPVFTRAADLPTDGSILLAIYEPEASEPALQVVPFAGNGFKRILVLFTGRTDGAEYPSNLPTGWSWNS